MQVKKIKQWLIAKSELFEVITRGDLGVVTAVGDKGRKNRPKMVRRTKDGIYFYFLNCVSTKYGYMVIYDFMDDNMHVELLDAHSHKPLGEKIKIDELSYDVGKLLPQRK